MSDYVKWDLDLLTEDDEVSISSDEREMKIFITNGGGTKILIYDNDYSVRHIHKTCCASLTWYKETFFLWDGLYKYCWNTDCAWLVEWVDDENKPIWKIAPDQWTFFQQKLSAFIAIGAKWNEIQPISTKENQS